MKGELVPLVMLPRFTSLVGGGTFATVPLDVSEYEGAAIEFWRGHLAGKTQSPPATFAAYFEEAEDPGGTWTELASTTTDDGWGLFNMTFSRRWFRMRIVLVRDTTYGLAAITCWAAGSLERRIPRGAAPAP